MATGPEARVDTSADPAWRIETMLAGMVHLESAIRACATNLPLQSHPRAAVLLEEASAAAAEHEQALRDRLSDLDGTAGSGVRWTSFGQNDFLGLGDEHAVSSRLRDLHGLVERAVVGYATLQTVCNRLRDTWVAVDEGSSGHLAREHTQAHLAISGRILTLLPDIVRWELDRAAVPCRCTCPSCDVGLCVCSVSARTILGTAWASAQPTAGEFGVELPAIRPGSEAERAGLEAGDVVIAIEGRRVDAHAVMQFALDELEPGSPVELKVRRGTRELNIRSRRPHGVPRNANTCIDPNGQVFVARRAEALRQQIQARVDAVGPGHSAPELAALTPRELQVLDLLCQGRSNPQIATQLDIGRPTVAKHVASILAKLGASNRLQASRIAAAEGLVDTARPQRGRSG